MLVVACILAFLAAAARCAERLWRAERAVACLPTAVAAVSLWIVLLTMRTPTPGRALLAFLLVDLALLAISVLGVLRLLGGFDVLEEPRDDRWRDDDGDGDGGEPSVPSGGAPVPARRPTGVSGSRRSARGSGRRAPARSSSGRSGRARS